jgi:hypothetical protein
MVSAQSGVAETGWPPRLALLGRFAHEIALADRDPLPPQDVVRRGRMEVEVRLREGKQKILCRVIDTAVGESESNIAADGGIDLGRADSLKADFAPTTSDISTLLIRCQSDSHLPRQRCPEPRRSSWEWHSRSEVPKRDFLEPLELLGTASNATGIIARIAQKWMAEARRHSVTVLVHLGLAPEG